MHAWGPLLIRFWQAGSYKDLWLCKANIGSGLDTFSWQTDFPPILRHIILEGESISCLVGQIFLGKCVPPDTSAWRTDFPLTPEFGGSKSHHITTDISLYHMIKNFWWCLSLQSITKGGIYLSERKSCFS